MQTNVGPAPAPAPTPGATVGADRAPEEVPRFDLEAQGYGGRRNGGSGHKRWQKHCPTDVHILLLVVRAAVVEFHGIFGVWVGVAGLILYVIKNFYPKQA